MKPEVLAALFGGAAAGAVLNQLFGFLTSWMDRRHERQKWLLDKRLEAYVHFNGLMNRWTADAGEVDDERLLQLTQELVEQEDRLNLLVPIDTSEKLGEVVSQMFEAGSVIGRLEPDDDDSERAVREAVLGVSRLFGDLLKLQRRDVQGEPFWHRFGTLIPRRRPRQVETASGAAGEG